MNLRIKLVLIVIIIVLISVASALVFFKISFNEYAQIFENKYIEIRLDSLKTQIKEIVNLSCDIINTSDSENRNIMTVDSILENNSITENVWIIEIGLPYKEIRGIRLGNSSSDSTLLNTMKNTIYRNCAQMCTNFESGYYIAEDSLMVFASLLKKNNWVVGSYKNTNSINTSLTEFEYIKQHRSIGAIVLFLILGGVILFVSVFIIGSFAFTYSNSIKAITKDIEELGLGIQLTSQPTREKDETGILREKLNRLVDYVNNNIEFAQILAVGKLNTEFTAKNNEDNLGNALLSVRKSLVKAKKNEERRIEENEKRNWLAQGITMFNELLRQQTEDTSRLADIILENLIKYVKANQGGLFLYNDDDPENVYFELISTYAYDRKRFEQKQILPGEGLVGNCALEKQTMLITNIPEDHIKITSGVGEAKPENLLIVPLLVDTNVTGIIELASFEKFNTIDVEFIEKTGENIASTLSAANTARRTKILLAQSEKHSGMMIEKEKELLQNLEELQSTQEESAKRENEMKGLFDALNANMMVIEYDMNGKIINVNNRFLDLFETDKKNVIGRLHSDFARDMTKSKGKYKEFWNLLYKGQIVKQLTKVEDKTHLFWFRETYAPVINRDGHLYKIINIAMDVTKNRRKEKRLHKQIADLQEKLSEFIHTTK